MPARATRQGRERLRRLEVVGFQGLEGLRTRSRSSGSSGSSDPRSPTPPPAPRDKTPEEGLSAGGEASPLARWFGAGGALRRVRTRFAEQLLDGRPALLLPGRAGRRRARARRDQDLRARVAADRRRERDLGKHEAAHVADHRLRSVPGDPRALDEVDRGPQRAGQLAFDALEDQLLAAGPVGVVLARVLEVLAGPGEGKRLVAVEMVLAAIELQRDRRRSSRRR